MSAFDGTYWTVQGTVCNATQYSLSKTANANITCLTHGQSIGLAVSILLICFVFVPDSSFVQLTAEASVISCVAVIIILVLIGVRPTSFHMSFLFHRILHRGTYDGIE